MVIKEEKTLETKAFFPFKNVFFIKLVFAESKPI